MQKKYSIIMINSTFNNKFFIVCSGTTKRCYRDYTSVQLVCANP